jgi:DNA topoisomerase-1
MEVMLDNIASGNTQWSDLCRDCNTTLDKYIKQIKKTDKPVIKIDEHHTYTIGRYGPVIKCEDENGVSFKQINKRLQIDFEKLRNGGYTLNELMYHNNSNTDSGNSDNITPNFNGDKILGEHDGNEVVLKNGKFGVYVTIGGKNTSLKYLDKPIDDIKLNDVVEYITKKGGSSSSNIIKQLSTEVSIRKGRYGPYVFYKTSSMNRPKFISMKGVSPEEVTLAWVETKLNE